MPDLDLIATKTRLVIRKSRRFTPSGFLQTLLGSVVTGLASLNQLAASLNELLPASMARQSLHARFDIRGKDLVAEVRQGGVIWADGDTLAKRLRASRHDLIDLARR